MIQRPAGGKSGFPDDQTSDKELLARFMLAGAFEVVLHHHHHMVLTLNVKRVTQQGERVLFVQTEWPGAQSSTETNLPGGGGGQCFGYTYQTNPLSSCLLAVHWRVPVEQFTLSLSTPTVPEHPRPRAVAACFRCDYQSPDSCVSDTGELKYLPTLRSCCVWWHVCPPLGSRVRPLLRSSRCQGGHVFTRTLSLEEV